MKRKEGPPVEEVVAGLMTRLADAASTLNSVSDALGTQMTRIDELLKKMNLGISCWTSIKSGDDWSLDLGYAKVDRIWGIALRSSRGSREAGTYEEQLWLFNDASRYMRLDTAGKIPQLLEALLVQAEEMTKQVRARFGQVQTMADAMSTVIFVNQNEG